MFFLKKGRTAKATAGLLLSVAYPRAIGPFFQRESYPAHRVGDRLFDVQVDRFTIKLGFNSGQEFSFVFGIPRRLGNVVPTSFCRQRVPGRNSRGDIQYASEGGGPDSI